MATELTGVQFGGAPNVAPSAGASTNVGLGVQGGQQASQQGLSGADWYDNGMDAAFGGNIPQFLEEAFAPALNAAKQQRVWDGFVRARQGATMQEIADEQPWYTQVFGPTDYELGAQLYTVQKAMGDTEQDVMTRMTELRELPPAEMAKELNRMNQALMTGDPFADALVQKSFMDRAAVWMDTHTKHRTAWLQTEQVRMQVDAIGSALGAYQASVSANAALGNSTPMDPSQADRMAASKLAVVDTLGFSRFQTDASASEVVKAAVKRAADSGQFHAIKLLRESGWMQANLEAEDYTALERYIEAADFRNKREWELRDDNIKMVAMAEARAGFGIGGTKTMNEYLAIDQRYRAETGSEVGYYTAAQVAAAAGRSTEGHVREQQRVLNSRAEDARRAADASAKEAGITEDTQAATQAYRRGTVANIRNLPHVDSALIDKAVAVEDAQLREAGRGDIADGMIVWNISHGGYVNSDLQRARIAAAQVAVSNPEAQGAALTAYQEWSRLRNTKGFKLNADNTITEDTGTGGAVAAARMYGEDLNRQFVEMDTAIKGGMPFDLAYTQVFGKNAVEQIANARGETREETERLVKANMELIQGLGPSTMQRVFGHGADTARPLSDHAKVQISRALVRAQQHVRFAVTDPDEAAAAQWQYAQSAFGAEIHGKYYWENGSTTDRKSVGAWVGVADGRTITPVVENLIDSRLREAGAEPSENLDVTVLRTDNADGSPKLLVYARGRQGWVQSIIEGREIREAWDLYGQQRRETKPELYNPFNMR